MRVERLEAHVKEIAKEHKIRCYYLPKGTYYRAYATERRVHVPKIVNWRAYGIALHELGHVTCGHIRYYTWPGEDNSTLILNEEIEAWEFAQRESLIELPEQWINLHLEAYSLNGAEAYGWKGPPHYNHRVWRKIGITRQEAKTNAWKMNYIGRGANQKIPTSERRGLC